MIDPHFTHDVTKTVNVLKAIEVCPASKFFNLFTTNNEGSRLGIFFDSPCFGNLILAK
ncbi:hypothetical protein D3C72_2000970 [compost metagenome]